MSRRDEKLGQGVTAIVLAAGTSHRMGAANKLLLPYGGQPIVTRVVASICKADIAACIVVLGHEADRVKAALQGLPVSFVFNEAFSEGMGTSIAAGVQQVGAATTGFLVCLSDMPLIKTEEYNAIIHKFEAVVDDHPAAIVRPRHAGRPGNPVLLSSHYKPAMQALQGAEGCKPIVKQHGKAVVFVEMPANHVLLDADTPEAYAALPPKSKNGA